MRKFILLPIILWFLISLLEFMAFIMVEPKPMYFRAWEFALNEGKDGYYVTFKPNLVYNGKMSGDLLSMMKFTPSKNEIRNQFFQTDEYGFRNKPNLLKNTIEAVIVGTSFVGGAFENQENLISSQLTDKYNIPTYNYATLPLQHFWEDERFIQNPPKYVIIAASEAEILQNTWVEVLNETKQTHPVPGWGSYKKWNDINNTPTYSYDYISKTLKRFSYIRYFAKQIYLNLLNSIFSREQIARINGMNDKYEEESGYIFFEKGSYDPRLTKASEVNVYETVKTLVKTRSILAERNIKLIIAVMPSKVSLYSRDYKNIDPSQKSLFLLNEKLKDNGFQYLDLLKTISTDPKGTYYYKEDSHWNTRTNLLISQMLADIIKQ